MGSWALGYPFLTSHAQYGPARVVGGKAGGDGAVLRSGVFCICLGATVLMLIALAHQSIRKPFQGGEDGGPAEQEVQ